MLEGDQGADQAVEEEMIVEAMGEETIEEEILGPDPDQDQEAAGTETAEDTTTMEETIGDVIPQDLILVKGEEEVSLEVVITTEEEACQEGTTSITTITREAILLKSVETHRTQKSEYTYVKTSQGLSP